MQLGTGAEKNHLTAFKASKPDLKCSQRQSPWPQTQPYSNLDHHLYILASDSSLYLKIKEIKITNTKKSQNDLMYEDCTQQLLCLLKPLGKSFIIQ